MIKRVADIPAEEMEGMRGGEGKGIRFLYEEAGKYDGSIKMMAVMDILPGSSIGYHEHVDDMEMYLILDGVAKVNDDGVDDVVNPGDLFITERGQGHGLVNETDEHVTFLAIIIG
jgi:quercetin dioxygenase-like cupin family protein